MHVARRPESGPGSGGCRHSRMARDIVFFLAPDDRKAATYRRETGAAMETVTGCGLEPDTAIAQWDL